MKYLRLLFLVIFLPFVYLSPITGCATTKPTTASSREDTLPKEEELKVSEYILGPGDKVEIAVYRHDELNKTLWIGPSGKIIYPLVGDIQAAGLSIFQLRDEIRDGLSKYIINPRVGISVTSVQSQKVVVLGEVSNPGFFSLSRPLNVLEAISTAGGFTLDAKQNSVLLIRGGLDRPKLKTLDLKKALKKGDLTFNVALQGGDIVYVPASFIAQVDRFFEHLTNILRPIVTLEHGIVLEPMVEDVLKGKEVRPGIGIVPP